MLLFIGISFLSILNSLIRIIYVIFEIRQIQTIFIMRNLKNLNRFIFYFILFPILLCSCSENKDYMVYEIEYKIDAHINTISKIVYTSNTGNHTFEGEVKNKWNVRVRGRKGQTVKLEIFGKHEASQHDPINLQINAHIDSQEYVLKRKEFNSPINNNFHYFMICVLN